MKGEEIITTDAIYYALFRQKLFDDKMMIQRMPPKNFGVFTTIRRSQKIESWPEDIHGCIGYWDEDFKELTKEELYENLLRVSYDAMWNDRRRSYFGPIEDDPNTLLEIDFMKQPLYTIDKRGKVLPLNQRFDNDKFGIIIQSKDGSKKSTFLPHVFEGIPFERIVTLIKDKAGIKDNDFDLYAYQIEQLKAPLLSLLTQPIFGDANLFQFSRLLVNNMRPELKYPLPYLCKDDFLEWESDDEVRNIATLSDLLRYSTLYPELLTPKELKFLEERVFEILDNLDNYSSQALSFLGPIYSLYERKDKDKFCQKLLTDLPSSEEEFARSEIILGLTKAGCNLNLSQYLPPFTSNDSIFKINWIIQAMESLNEKIPPELIQLLLRRVDEILSKKSETNYLAVAFEALAFAYSSTKDPTLLEKAFKLLFELDKRKSCYNTLYAFLDGSSRVDITGHVNNGLVKLIF